MAYIYSAADVFLNLSYCENYPTVNLEARACGTPVIVYGTGGSAESAGSNSIIIEKGDIDSLVEEVRKVSLKGDYCKWVGEAELVDKSNSEREYIRSYTYNKLDGGIGEKNVT